MAPASTSPDELPHVLVVDDERAVRESLSRALRLHDYRVSLAADGLEALAAVGTGDVDVVVLDVAMPGIEGTGVARRLRQDGDDVPILMLTARDGVEDRVAGLDAGADDYLPKPFALDELLARLRALLRRRGDQPADVERQHFHDLVLDHATFRAHRAGRDIDLTRTEYDLLAAFMDNPRRVLTREVLGELVWGSDLQTSNNVEVYVGYLRRKLEAAGEPRLLQTVRGFGYRLDEPTD
ncbi:response regulator transcription factor [Salsipaludibacter albus]|uniref:response regulator transcription factor n=1 Tax=Salsipaludibacter albus TaxID=2849650 RepID=UPI001EE4D179|nr:response regulator transcription factor [Salsipaludibacter albus]MBY5162413.1 response regulator transcription factor [Salsipaludibacter albus]